MHGLFLFFYSFGQREMPSLHNSALHEEPQASLLADVFRGWERLASHNGEIAEYPDAPFARALHPFIAHGVGLVERTIGPITSVDGIEIRRPEFCRALGAELARRLDRACRRVLVLELHVARLEERLLGGTSENRFEDFLVLLRDAGEWKKLLTEYPVMARSIAVIVANFVDAVTELVRRLQLDAPAIRSLLLPDARNVMLFNARGGISDLHRSGRSVWIFSLSAEDGRQAQLVYKPRDLSGDRCFQGLLRWLDERSDLPPLRAVRTIERESYGWMEFIARAPCNTREEIARFYTRQGAFLAVTHLLRATDLHTENVIASTEHPVLVDLETLFHGEHRAAPTDDTAASLALRKLTASVIRVGLLPFRVFGSEYDDGLNLGGMGTAGPQQTPFPVPAWDRAETDDMRWAKRAAVMAEGHNIPRMGDEAIPVTAHEAELVAGFASMYRLILARREELLTSEGPLAPFASAETRYLIRPTQSYARILEDAVHPDNQRGSAEVETLLSTLRWVDGDIPDMDRVIDAEREDLRAGDVPFFTARPDSLDLWDSRGRRIPAYFRKTTMSEVRDLLATFSEDDLAWQTWLIRASIEDVRPMSVATPARSRRRVGAPVSSVPDTRGGAVDIEALVSEARRVGERLLATAIVGRGDVTWLSLVGAEERRQLFSPVGRNVYEGVPGIALFLAYLGQVTDDARFTSLARHAAESMARVIQEEGEAFPRRLGGFSGEAGHLYVLACLSRLYGDPSLAESARGAVRGFSRLWSDDVHNDVLSGSAGTILALLAFHEVSHVSEALDVAVQGALALSDRAGDNVASLWRREEIPLLGFSHGVAGISCALYMLLNALRAHGSDAPVQRIRALADHALAYERERFDPALGNWPILHLPDPGASPDRITWCHGAPGVALGRTLALPFLDNAEVRREIEVAVHTTLSRGMGDEPLLCHGDLGNLMVLTHVATTLRRPSLRDLAARHALRVVADLQRERASSDAPMREAVPNLLTGLAGVGYGLLYQAYPDVVPLVLGLRPPPG